MGEVHGPAGLDAVRWWFRMARDPLRAHVALVRQYGDGARLRLRRGRGYYVLTRPEQAEHMLVSHHANFTKSFTIRTIRAFLGDGLLTSDGELWQRHRRLVQPAFAHRHVAGFAPVMADAAARRAATWRDGEVVDVAAEMRAVTLDVVGRALFGSELREDAARIGGDLAALQRGALVGVFLPVRSEDAIRVLARVSPHVGSAAQHLDGLVRRVVDTRRVAPHDEPRDLLDLLLASGLDDAEVRDEVMTLLLAGHETTAAALAWALVLLSRNPAAREPLEQEADDDPGATDLDRLPWTHAVVSETLRLCPPAWRLTRDAVDDDEIGGVPVPARSTISVPPYLLHRNPDVWPEPEAFVPQRFLPPPDLPRCAYLPFGAGRRTCVGSGFALLEATLVLAAIARTHRLDLLPGTTVRPRAEITLRPAGPVPMRVRVRARPDRGNLTA
jgi:cytochrome P450